MPEGPEIRRAADRLAEAVAGDPLVHAEFAFPNLKRFERELVGRRIESITPRGKALLTRFDHGWTMYSHNQLYGVWKIAAPGERPETKRSLRVALETARSAILLYSASDVSMWPGDEVQSHPFLVTLGPDVLDPGLDVGAVADRLRDVEIDERQFDRLEAIILSMTPAEREKPAIINPSRKRRIAAGCGMKVEDVNRLLKQYDTMRQMMKQMGGKPGKNGKKGKLRKGMLPGLGGPGFPGGFPMG